MLPGLSHPIGMPLFLAFSLDIAEVREVITAVPWDIAVRFLAIIGDGSVLVAS